MEDMESLCGLGLEDFEGVDTSSELDVDENDPVQTSYEVLPQPPVLNNKPSALNPKP